MFLIKMAEYVFQVDNRYAYVEQLCRDYLTSEPAQIYISVSEEEILQENRDGGNWSEGYLEALAIYRKICELVLEEDIILFHCSALEIDGKAYLFTAPSGTGKSTHTRLWRETFGDRVTMINDDKPLLKISDKEICAFGTPYGGKDGLQTNTQAPVAGIVILHQSSVNTMVRLTAEEAYPVLLNQTYRRNDMQGMIKTMDLVHTLCRLPVYSLGCTISKEAAMLACKTLLESEQNE